MGEDWCGTEEESETDQAIEDSTLTYSIFCNDATTDAEGEALDDVADYVYWRYWVWSGDGDEGVLAACTETDDCAEDDEACGELSISNDISGNYCVPIADWCSSCSDTEGEENDCDHGLSWDIPNSLSTFYIDCSGDNYFNNWAWLVDNDWT